MKSYISSEKNFYKANLHNHSTATDGRLTPEEIKTEYMAHGYSIVAFTDHEVVVPHPELRDDDFLPITSYELAVSSKWHTFVKCYHLNVYMPDPDRDVTGTFCLPRVKPQWLHQVNDGMKEKGVESRPYSKECAQNMIDIANSEGCLVSYNHPVWSNQNYVDYSGLKGIWGVEWHNNECTRMGYYDTVQPIDDLLNEGERVFPLATDDCHSRASYGGGWISVKARSLDYGTVFAALRKGDFYSSNGPAIKSLWYEDGKVTIKTSAARQIILHTGQRISKAVNAADKLVTEGTFDLTPVFDSVVNAPEGRDVWWRIEVIDKAGKRAMTRAYFLDELK